MVQEYPFKKLPQQKKAHEFVKDVGNVLLEETWREHHLRCIKPCKEWDKLQTSGGEFAGFLDQLTVALLENVPFQQQAVARKAAHFAG